MTPIPAKVLTVAKQSSQFRVLVQIELEKYLGSFHTLRFGERKPFTGSCHNGQLDLFYRDPGIKVGKSFPLWTIMVKNAQRSKTVKVLSRATPMGHPALRGALASSPGVFTLEATKLLPFWSVGHF